MNTTRRSSGSPGIALMAGFLALAVAWPSSASPSMGFPSPLTGPGVGDLKKSQIKKIDRGWRELAAGDFAESRKRAARAGDAPARRLLDLQIRLQAQDPDTINGLQTFCEQHPGYAAAWFTLSVAAERAGSEVIALEAARRGETLWPDPPWGDRPGELYSLWVDQRIARAGHLFDEGRSSDAMAELDAARELDPTRQDATVILAKILMSNGQVDEADSLLDSVTEMPEAVFLQGALAEERGDWQRAMERYSALPANHPERETALERAQMRWRLTLLPTYARSSMAAKEVTRGDLAVMLVSVQPRLETLPGGDVPVMSDIVDHPGQREIITVVRLGIMTSDRRGRRFFPDTPAGAETVRDAVQRTRSLLGLAPLVWCDTPDVVGSACTSIPLPVSGGTVVQAVLDSTSGADR